MLVRFRCGEKGYLLQVSDLSQQLSSETTSISMAENLPLGTAVVVVSWMGTERRAPTRHATRMLVVSFHNVKGTSPCSQVSPLTLSKTLAKSLTDYSEPNTYSIDLTSSWTNETVKLEKILKNGPPIVNQEALWQDAGRKAFYAYDGATSNAFDVQNPPSSNTLYQFLPDGAGFGAWSVVPAPANTNFSQLSRAFGAAYTSGNGLGFALGGLQNSQTIAGYPFDAVAQGWPGHLRYVIRTMEQCICSWIQQRWNINRCCCSICAEFWPKRSLIRLGGPSQWWSYLCQHGKR